MRSDIFICSTPLQLLNVLNIMQSTLVSGFNGYLFIVENFEINQISKDKIIHYYKNLFKKIIFVKTQDEVFDNIDCGTRTLVIYSDVGKGQKVFIERFSSLKVVIYEEGYATYHPTFAYSLLEKFKYYIKGYASYIGASSLVHEVIVYNPNIYCRSHGRYSCDSVIEFKSTFLEVLINNKDEFYDIFNFVAPSLTGVNNVLLLLFGEPENVEKQFKQALQKIDYYDLVVVKEHPRYCYNGNYLDGHNSEKIFYLDLKIPLEYFIYNCSLNNIVVDMYHESTTAAIYMKEYIDRCTNVHQDNDFKKEYNRLYCLF